MSVRSIKVAIIPKIDKGKIVFSMHYVNPRTGRSVIERHETEEAANARANEIHATLFTPATAPDDFDPHKWHAIKELEAKLCGVSIADAVEFFITHATKESHASSARARANTVARVGDLYVTDCLRRVSKQRGFLVEHHVKRFPFSSTSVIELKPNTVFSYLTSITNDNTRHTAKSIFSSMWRWGVLHGHIPASFTTLPQLIGAIKTTPKDPTIMSPATLRTALHRAEIECPHVIPALAVAAFAGVRSAEIGRMVWGKHINLNVGCVIVGSEISKTARRRTIPINDCLRAWLTRYPLADGVSLTGGTTLADMLLPLRNTNEWPTNVLRHSALSYMLAKIKNAAEVAELAGNSPVILQRSYKALATENAADEWFAIAPQHYPTP